MGMFDYINCKYPLIIEGANSLQYQTKDTPNQFMDLYEIREDGTLWVEEYDVEDQSELGKWEREHPNQEPPEELKNNFLKSFAGSMTRINNRWKQCMDYSGELRFYTFTDDKHSKGWIEWSAYFYNGKLEKIHLIEHKPH